MRTVPLGASGLPVARLCFGTAYLGPLSDRLSAQDGAALLLEALRQGVSFWDTSDDYGTHAHVREALRQVRREQVVVASKTRQPAGAVARILAELDTAYLDVLLMHEVSLHQIREAQAALESWQLEVERGRLRAVGLSTHSARVIHLAAGWPELDVLMVPINEHGVLTPDTQIEDGKIDDVLRAVGRAWERGKGIVAMKVMGCGALAGDPAAAMAYAAGQPHVHSLCIGMRNGEQIAENVRLLNEP